MDNHAALPSVGSKKPRFFYGYVVALASFFVMIMAFGSQYSFGVFFKPISAEFGWTRATTSGAYSLFMVLFGFFCIVVGRLNDRFGPRLVVTGCGLFTELAYLLMSQINATWQLYFFYGVILAIGMSATTVPLLSTIARWFVKRRGLMTGITVSGAPLGTTIMPPILAQLIVSYGWRTSFLIVGIIVLILIIVAAQFLRRDPRQIGQLPYGESEATEIELASGAEGFSFRETIRTRHLWEICIIWVCAGFFAQATIVHIVPYATDLGISAIAASGIIAINGGIGVAGRIVMGGCGDRIGNKLALIIGFILMLVAFIWLVVAKELWMFYLFAGIFGLAISAFMSLRSPLVAELFGMRAHGAILGMVTFAWAIGGAAGPFVTGHIFDITNSYYWAFVGCAVLSIIGLIIVSLLKPTHREGLL